MSEFSEEGMRFTEILAQQAQTSIQVFLRIYERGIGYFIIAFFVHRDAFVHTNVNVTCIIVYIIALFLKKHPTLGVAQ